MNIYKVTRNDPVDYDQFSAAIVIAPNAKRAVEILKEQHANNPGVWGTYDVTVEAIVPVAEEIVLAAFHAG
jgi:hypothetical protein